MNPEEDASPGVDETNNDGGSSSVAGGGIDKRPGGGQGGGNTRPNSDGGIPDDTDMPDATVSDDGGEQIEPVPTCPEDTCCVGGVEYEAGETNPRNRCEGCVPEKDTTAFSVVDAAECGDGCVCRAGEAQETNCSDAEDNDADGKLNCADADCDGQLCQGQRDIQVYPTRDVGATQGRPGGSHESDGEATISIKTSPTGVNDALLEFDHIPRDGSVNVIKAVIYFYIETVGGIFSVLDSNGRSLGSASETLEGFRTLDITDFVRKWADGSELQRYVLIRLDQPSPGSATMRTTEFAGVRYDPHIYLTYEARCSNKTCPKF